MAEPAEQVSDEAFEAAWDEHNAPELEAVETPEAPEPPETETAETAEVKETETGEVEEVEEVEDLLEPHQNWPAETQELFRTFNRTQQDAWMERERQVQQGFQQKAAEHDNTRRAFTELQEMIAPFVPDWQRMGMTPTQGVMQMSAIYDGLRQDPANMLMQLANDFGVNLEEIFKEQPYVDPATRQLQNEFRQTQDELRRMRFEQEQAAQYQQQQAHVDAVEQVKHFASLKDDTGSLRYPYAMDKTVMQEMSAAIDSGRARDLHEAYDVAMAYMKSHPVFADQVKQKSSQTQAEVSKAKRASKTVEGDAPTDIPNDDSDDRQLEKLLEEAGYTD